MADDYRVEVDLDDERHGFTLGERFRSLSLDDQARERLGDDAVVTRDGSHVFVYVGEELAVREAERIVRQLLVADGLSARVAVTRWHPVERDWRDLSEPLPATGEEVEAERERYEQSAEVEVEQRGDSDWWVRVDLEGMGEAGDLHDRLRDAGFTVRRRWKHLLVAAPSEEGIGELADRIRELAPEGAELSVQLKHFDYPLYVFVEAHKPGIARDLGL